MKVLNFCSYFIGSKVYRNLFLALAQNNVKSQVFVPIRTQLHRDANNINHDNIEINYNKCLSLLTRFFYCLKLLFVTKAFGKTYKQDSLADVFHAHTLYGDGIPAFLCARRHNKKLVITLRNTDVNLGFKYYRHYKWLAKLALKYSTQIIFVSPGHKIKFQQYFGDQFDNKLVVIPNGIDPFFIDKVLKEKKEVTQRAAIYAGEINKNKNIESAIKAFALSNDNSDWTFTVVGGDYSSYLNSYKALEPQLKEKVTFIPRVAKEELVELYDKASIFIMPSHKETFGLVYIEAISRCLPVVYTKGQGIDGYYAEGKVGFSCDPNSLQDITQAITKSLKCYPQGLQFDNKNLAQDYAWDSIAKLYKNSVY